MKTTSGRLGRPAFNPDAEYVAAVELLWGVGDGQTIKLPALSRFDFDELKCDGRLAHALYQSNKIAMVLNDDETPKLRGVAAEPAAPIAPEPVAVMPPAPVSAQAAAASEPDVGALRAPATASAAAPEPSGSVCDRCGKEFRTKKVPYFHIKHCKGTAANVG
jgi:hypothetical protein